MKITIITVCFNSEDLIEKTLVSVFRQDYPMLEYIIIDGGSTDKTLDVIQNYRSGISVFISEKDNGIYDAMNKGLAHASGDLIYFLNSGDYFCHNGILREIIGFINRFPDYGIYTGDVMYFDETGAERLSGYRKSITDIIARVINHQSIIAKKSVFDTCGVFDTQYKIYADYDWYLRAVLKNNVRMKYTGISFAFYLKAGKSDRVWRKYLYERAEILRKYTTPVQLLQYAFTYPGDSFSFILNYVRGLFISD